MHHISGPISGMASPYSRRLSIGSGSSRSFRVSSESAATGFELAPLGAFDAKAGVLPTKLQWCLTINDRTVETRTTLFNTGSARSAVLSTEGVLSTEAFAPLKNTIKVTPLSDSLSASLSFGGFTPPTLNGAFAPHTLAYNATSTPLTDAFASALAFSGKLPSVASDALASAIFTSSGALSYAASDIASILASSGPLSVDSDKFAFASPIWHVASSGPPWHISHKAWNRLIHSLHGNGTTMEPLIRRLNTYGMPTLDTGAITPEKYLEFKIELQGWAASNSVSPWILGPIPAAPQQLGTTTATFQAASDRYNDHVQQGMRYVCAAIKDANLRSAMAIGVGAANQNGPACIQWLNDEILQGIDEQPALQTILDTMALQPKESLVAFKARFSKINAALNPAPAHQTTCAKYIAAITKDTGGFYDDCITAALSSANQANFNAFANSLTRLCTNKLMRSEKTSEQTNVLLTEVRALQTAMKNQALELSALRDTLRTTEAESQADQDGIPAHFQTVPEDEDRSDSDSEGIQEHVMAHLTAEDKADLCFEL